MQGNELAMLDFLINVLPKHPGVAMGIVLTCFVELCDRNYTAMRTHDATVCSYVSFTYYQIYLRTRIAKKIRL
jgi:hypothetical protein